MQTIKRLVLTAVSALTFFASTSSTAFAQFDGETAQIPENAPTNWTTGFVAWPILALAIFTLVAVLAYYGVKLFRVRYPVKAGKAK